MYLLYTSLAYNHNQGLIYALCVLEKVGENKKCVNENCYAFYKSWKR
jgi:hypothetical protein